MTSSVLLGCLKIFCCRICDVSLGAMRTILMVKERSVFAMIIGFFEVMLWYLVVRDAINFDGPVLLVHGTDDRIVDISYSRRAQTVYPHCEYHEIIGGGHGFSGEHDKQAVRYLKSFLQPSAAGSNME